MFSYLKKIQLHQICIIFIASLLFVRLLLVFSFSIDLDGAEFVFVHNIQLLYQNIDLYRNPDAFPYYAVMYMPLYYYIILILTNILGVNPIYEIHKVFVISRAINFGMILCCLYYIYNIMMQFSISKKIIYIHLLFFVLLLTGHFYAARPDGIKLTLFIFQLYGIIQYFYLEKKHRKYLILIISTNILSFVLKQDSFFYSNMLLFALILSKRNKQSVKIFICCILLSLISYFFFAMVFGKYFYINTYIYNFQMIIDFKNSYNIIVIFMSFIRLLLPALLCIYLIWQFRSKMAVDSVEFLLAAATIPLFLTAHIFMLKSGAFLNYSYELIVLLILLSAKLVSTYHLQMQLPRKMQLFFVTYLIVLMVTNNILKNYKIKQVSEKPYKSLYTTNYETAKEIKNTVKDEYFFLPNGNNIIYYSECRNLFYGYEAHIDRYINLSLDLDVKSKLIYASSENVDNSFKNGIVKFIVIENNLKSKNHMQKYYPNYAIYKIIKDFSLYKFDSKTLE